MEQTSFSKSHSPYNNTATTGRRSARVNSVYIADAIDYVRCRTALFADGELCSTEAMSGSSPGALLLALII